MGFRWRVGGLEKGVVVGGRDTGHAPTRVHIENNVILSNISRSLTAMTAAETTGEPRPRSINERIVVS